MSNPFEDNPFADPSIQNVTQTTQRTQMTLEDYNPFAQNNTTLAQQNNTAAIIPTAIKTAPQPTPLPVIQPAPPAYTPTAAQNINIDSIRRQEEELSKKAAELDRKEQALRNAELGNGVRINNFPPLPGWCPGKLKPCFYQDISVEIPIDFQKWVRMLYYLWIFHGCTLFFNCIGAVVVWIAGGDDGVSFGLSLLYFFLFTPCSYMCWFRPAYKAFRSDSSFNFMAFFFIFFCQIIINCLEAVGFGESGFCGMVLAINLTKSGYSLGIVLYIWLVSVLFVITGFGNLFVLYKIHRLYRSTGASFEQAQKEFASNVLSNKNVQSAATTVITESARATVQNYNTNNNSTPGRF